ncbi:hypothetical protein EAb13_CDS0074 [Acinetobacter phage EAb13]|nr:hypothetical protein EAb13_CDS0074 [Acinetobacter phage EAb13]
MGVTTVYATVAVFTTFRFNLVLVRIKRIGSSSNRSPNQLDAQAKIKGCLCV